MDKLHTEAEISFRFLRLDKLQAYTLEREIFGASHNKQSNNHDYCGYAPLTKQNLDDINDYFVRQRIEIEQCDIFISVNSPLETNIIDIPAIVNRMLKYIDCKLTFSFTVK
jgi:hypothetical protein